MNDLSPGIIVPSDEGALKADPPPTREVLAGGPRAGWQEGIAWQSSPVDQAIATMGHRLWPVLLTDPKAEGSVETLKESVLIDGVDLSPADDSVEARRIFDFNDQARRQMDTPLEDVLYQIMDAPVYASMLAEQVYREVRSGPFKGKLMLDRLAVKPRWAWAYVCDKVGKVTGIYGNSPDEEARVFPRGKFAILSWMPKNGSPSGSHALRSAYLAINTKFQLFPRYYNFLRRFAEPSLVGTAGEGIASRPQVDADGNYTGKMISAIDEMVAQMQMFESGSLIAIPHGATLKALEVQGEGQAYLGAMDWLDRQIVFAILHQTRATMEAEHGSKADSETAAGILGQAARRGRQAVENMLRRDVFYQQTLRNFGQEAADRWTPKVSLGTVDYDDLIRFSNAIAKLAESGYLAESQLPSLDKLLKLPVRTPGSPRLTSVPAQQGPEGAKGGRPPSDKKKVADE